MTPPLNKKRKLAFRPKYSTTTTKNNSHEEEFELKKEIN